MSKVDVTKIAGYDTMTPEEKLSAVLAYEMPDPDYSGYVSKETFDRTSSELAAKKKELAAHMSEEERRALADKEKQDEILTKYNELLRKSTISEHKARLLGLGYEEKLAQDTAEAIADGNIEKVFANQAAHQTALEKKIRTSALQDTPKPTGDGGSKTMTYDQFRKLPPHERYQFSVDHPDEYKQIYESKNKIGGNT